ncbi:MULTISPECIES: hypothetical protein [unclassified Streptomyces]|uniref:hypothetical protein n=1 Tax=unclassified Streptomyces TaxID=2593676 RepID=UPI0022AEBCB7|nr:MULTISPECIES: hypothetical protein [unclassified Streptomyces]MCZ4098263.1 hypothetical protein [Streptomyces sp. H39-C1]MDF9812980.1 hypothetical protein [Streptomyces sp. SPB162]
MGIELGRVLARLEESGGVENVALNDESAHEVLGALSIVDPKHVGCEAERLSGNAAR